MEPVCFEHVSKAFDGRTVLSDFSETFLSGITCILGESGSGKTTLLRLAAGLIQPDSGTVRCAATERQAFVFQENRLFEAFNVYRNLKLVAPRGSFARQTALRMLESVGLAESVLLQPVAELSGGMKRRISVLRALLCDSDYVFLDEPTSGLDEDTKRLTAAYIREKTKSKTVLWVTHDEEEAGRVGDRILKI